MTDLSGRLASGDTLYGTFLGLGSALAAEACALAGFDWLLTDLEHGGGDESELLPQQLAADAHGVPMLVRVESTHRIRAGHALDLGAAGIMFPGIESAEQATQAIRHPTTPRTGTAASPPTTAPTDSACTPNGSRPRTSVSTP
jgi:2-dehydro-3-deoxyglucarate aldolase/4-hydroxy-2-oxoheptanedioate aldolase